MSSHHIVRDEQEPALLIWQPGQVSFEQVGELLEWSPRVIVHQQALAEVLHWGIKLDAVWAMPEGLAQAKEATDHQQPVSTFALPAQEPQLPEVLSWLAKKQQRSLHLLADAQAEDFLLLRKLESLQQSLQIQVISQGWRYSYFGKAAAQKWLPAQSLIRIIAFDQQPLLKGLTYKIKVNAQPLQEVMTKEDGSLQMGGISPFWLGEEL